MLDNHFTALGHEFRGSLSRRVGAGTVAALVGIVTLASPARAEGAAKYPLAGPYVNISCRWITPGPWENVTEVTPGFALFNLDAQGSLSVVAHLQGAPPETEFPVRLIQGVEDCWTVDGVLVTNAQGVGTLRLTEPDVGTRAQVVIDTSNLFGQPSYRATDFFVTD